MKSLLTEPALSFLGMGLLATGFVLMQVSSPDYRPIIRLGLVSQTLAVLVWGVLFAARRSRGAGAFAVVAGGASLLQFIAFVSRMG